ncbi:MAG TPA: fibronectin type III domain-containing protein, partial [Candidatus Syntrophosphaera sp.]|nr:fibronectin type III domain-containing protein [Candidatus Syntrophosphaera sp.]
QHTLYYYRVRAVNVVVYSAYSNEANATTLYTTPPAPSELAAEPISPSQIYLSWIDNAAVETGFRIERKIEDTGTWAEIAFVEANVTVYSDTGLEPHTHYYYRVRAVNVNVYSSYSNEANATTSYATPPAPSNLSAVTISSSQIILSWTDNSPNETGFRIEYRIGTAGTWSEIGSVEENLSAYVSDGLASYMTYFYRVRAYNDYGNSEYSNEANAITLLSSPENLSLMHFASNIFIMWDTVSGAQSYYVYRSVDPYAVDWGVPVAHTASTVFMDISSLNKCFYKIKASSIPLSVKSDDPANIIPMDIKNLLHK